MVKKKPSTYLSFHFSLNINLIITETDQSSMKSFLVVIGPGVLLGLEWPVGPTELLVDSVEALGLVTGQGVLRVLANQFLLVEDRLVAAEEAEDLRLLSSVSKYLRYAYVEDLAVVVRVSVVPIDLTLAVERTPDLTYHQFCGVWKDVRRWSLSLHQRCSQDNDKSENTRNNKCLHD